MSFLSVYIFPFLLHTSPFPFLSFSIYSLLILCFSLPLLSLFLFVPRPISIFSLLSSETENYPPLLVFFTLFATFYFGVFMVSRLVCNLCLIANFVFRSRDILFIAVEVVFSFFLIYFSFLYHFFSLGFPFGVSE